MGNDSWPELSNQFIAKKEKIWEPHPRIAPIVSLSSYLGDTNRLSSSNI